MLQADAAGGDARGAGRRMRQWRAAYGFAF